MKENRFAKGRWNWLGLLGAVLLMVGMADLAQAATRTWDGSSSALWTGSANWSGNTAPVNGDLLVFPAGPVRLSTTNVAGGATNLAAISITGSNYVLVSPPLSLTNGLTNASAINSTNTIRANITPRTDQTWGIGNRNTLVLESNVTIGAVTLTADIDGTLQFDGAINGGANSVLTKAGGGTLEINGSAALVNLEVQDGTLEVNGQLAAALNIADGAALAGNGNVPQFFCLGTVNPGSTGPGRLTVGGAGATVLSQGSTLFVTLAGVAPATEYDQLRVPGPFTLSGASLTVSLTFTPSVGDTFVIITNTGAGAINGTFVGLAEGAVVSAGATKFRISYVGGNGNDVTLTTLTTGQTRVWTRAGANNLWSNPTNWAGNIAPVSGDSLSFPAAVTNVSMRTMNNNFSNVLFNQLFFGGSNGNWVVNDQPLRLLGGIVATNGGLVVMQMAMLEVAANQVFQATNMSLSIRSEVRLAGHTLTAHPGNDGVISLSESNSGPGVINMVGSGRLGLRGDTGPGVAVNIHNGTTEVDGTHHATSTWQLTGGILDLIHVHLPALQATGGRVRMGEGEANGNVVQGNFSLAPASVFDCDVAGLFGNEPPLSVGGTVTLNGAAFAGGVLDVTLFGETVTIISNHSGSAVSGTFAGRPEGAIFASTNSDGFVFSNRISYVGGDGNDVTLTALVPAPSGFTREWTGNGFTEFWSDAANWLGNTTPGVGDAVRFPVNAPRRTNDHNLPLLLDGITWLGSNYVQNGPLALLGGLSSLQTSGTNVILSDDVFLHGDQTWTVSNALATLRIQDTNALQIRGGFLFSRHSLTKRGAGTLEFINLPPLILGGLTNLEGTLRIGDGKVGSSEGLLHVVDGRVELSGFSAQTLLVSDGELVLTADEKSAGASVRIAAFNSNARVHVDWSNASTKPGPALVVRDAIDLGGVPLDVSLPPGLSNGVRFVLIHYDAAAVVAGTFAGLAEGSITNLSGYRVQIHYVEGEGDEAGFLVTLAVLGLVPPQFTQIQRFPSGDVILRGTAKASSTVSFEATLDFVTWTPLGSAIVSPAGLFSFIDSPGVLTNRFYRGLQ